MTLLPRGHRMICHALACNKTYYDTDFLHLYVRTHLLSLGFFNCASRPIFLSPDCIQMRGKLENCLQLLRKKYQGFHLDSEFFFDGCSDFTLTVTTMFQDLGQVYTSHHLCSLIYQLLLQR